MNSADSTRPEFEKLLDYIKRARGFDFTGYKRASLMRRVLKRMQTVQVESFDDYIDYLEVHPDEFGDLFNTILINVTGFFRDAPVWDFLSAEVFPRIVRSLHPDEPVRVWSAGCASGEEAYTVAMLLAEALGVEAFRERVKVYATDVDQEALNIARLASYTARQVASVPAHLLDLYFERTGANFAFRKDLRRSVIFGRHDLIQDAPISRIDLLLCRNTLMYFNAETQAQIAARLNFALKDDGYFVLGRAEMLFSHTSALAPVDLKRRVFMKARRETVRDRFALTPRLDGAEDGTEAVYERARATAFDAGAMPQIVIDQSGVVAGINERARTLFNLSTRDVGRNLRDLEISYRPLELRGRIDQTFRDGVSVTEEDVEWSPGGERRWYKVTVAPLRGVEGDALGVSVTFADFTAQRRLQHELEHSHQELETAYEELQSTNEELETTNEELQSTVEELETTNEELQSTNEELETTNEELQSTNEELHARNEEVRRRSEDLDRANALMESILGSINTGIAVVDRELRVLAWNARATDMWGLRSDEVLGRNFLNLDIGLPVAELRDTLWACLADSVSDRVVTVPAFNRRGRSIRCRVSCVRLTGSERDTRGVIMVMEEENARVMDMID